MSFIPPHTWSDPSGFQWRVTERGLFLWFARLQIWHRVDEVSAPVVIDVLLNEILRLSEIANGQS